MGETSCPVCGKACEEIRPWYNSNSDNDDEFRTIIHESNGPFVEESCTETR